MITSTKIRIVTASAEGGEKSDPERMTQVFFYQIGLSPNQMSTSFVFDDKISIEIRPHQRSATIVVNLNVNDVVNNPQYKAAVRSLLGHNFGRFVCARVRSHRRRNINAERPYVKPRKFDAIVDRILLQMAKDEHARQPKHTMQQTEQLATT